MQLNARSFDFTSLHQQGLPILPTRNYVTDQPLNVAKQKRECPGWGTPTFIYVLHYVILQYLIHRSTFWPLASDALWSNQVITTQFSHESCFARNSMVVLLLLWLFFGGRGVFVFCFVLFGLLLEAQVYYSRICNSPGTELFLLLFSQRKMIACKLTAMSPTWREQLLFARRAVSSFLTVPSHWFRSLLKVWHPYTLCFDGTLGAVGAVILVLLLVAVIRFYVWI